MEESNCVLLEMVRTEASSVLGFLAREAIEAHRVFKDIGFDSLTAVELRNRLAAAAGVRLPATLIFDYPTPVALAAFLGDQLLGERPAVAAPPVVWQVTDEPVAIVAMGCRFPGGVYRRRVCGGWCRVVWMRCQGFRWIGGGIWRVCLTPTLTL